MLQSMSGCWQQNCMFAFSRSSPVEGFAMHHVVCPSQETLPSKFGVSVACSLETKKNGKKKYKDLMH